eukprot:3861419-Rhodomonas_salina.1
MGFPQPCPLPPPPSPPPPPPTLPTNNVPRRRRRRRRRGRRGGVRERRTRTSAQYRDSVSCYAVCGTGIAYGAMGWLVLR